MAEVADRTDRVTAADTRPVIDPRLPTWYRTLMQQIDAKIMAAIEPLLQPRTVTLWYVLDGGGVALAVNTYIESPVDFPFIITGTTMLSRTTGALVLDVKHASYSDYPTLTSIVASSPPTIAAYKSQDNTLTGWTTIIQGGDILAVSVTSNAGALTKISLGLRVTPMGQLRK